MLDQVRTISSILVMVLIACGMSLNASDNRPQVFKFETKRPDDKVECKFEQDRAIISIRCPFGISNAVIERINDAWPSRTILRLHLQGLEKFSITNNKLTLNATVGSSDGRQRMWKDKDESTSLDSESPYWIDIRMENREHKPTNNMPQKEGYFELHLPNALFEGNPKSITLNWIDFYR
jgi:hypothetical protein